MKECMLTSLNRRYTDVESNGPLVLAILDSRFKNKFFTGAADAKELLNQKVAELSSTQQPTLQARESSPKCAKTSVLQCFAEILGRGRCSSRQHTQHSGGQVPFGAYNRISQRKLL